MTPSEENYIKVIFHLSPQADKVVSTNAIAGKMDTRPSSVTDMLQKLADKGWVVYEKYKGVKLTEDGRHAAALIIRKHRLWEVFLAEKLQLNWDEVHDIAEQLEHVESDRLIEQLDAYLGFPTIDPHGDPIPDRNGKVRKIHKQLLSSLREGNKAICTGVKDSNAAFLQYLDKHHIALGSEVEVLARESYDNSFTLLIDGKETRVSDKIADNLYVQKH